MAVCGCRRIHSPRRVVLIGGPGGRQDCRPRAGSPFAVPPRQDPAGIGRCGVRRRLSARRARGLPTSRPARNLSRPKGVGGCWRRAFSRDRPMRPWHGRWPGLLARGDGGLLGTRPQPPSKPNSAGTTRCSVADPHGRAGVQPPEPAAHRIGPRRCGDRHAHPGGVAAASAATHHRVHQRLHGEGGDDSGSAEARAAHVLRRPSGHQRPWALMQGL